MHLCGRIVCVNRYQVSNSAPLSSCMYSVRSRILFSSLCAWLMWSSHSFLLCLACMFLHYSSHSTAANLVISLSVKCLFVLDITGFLSHCARSLHCLPSPCCLLSALRFPLFVQTILLHPHPIPILLFPFLTLISSLPNPLILSPYPIPCSSPPRTNVWTCPNTLST